MPLSPVGHRCVADERCSPLRVGDYLLLCHLVSGNARLPPQDIIGTPQKRQTPFSSRIAFRQPAAAGIPQYRFFEAKKRQEKTRRYVGTCGLQPKEHHVLLRDLSPACFAGSERSKAAVVFVFTLLRSPRRLRALPRALLLPLPLPELLLRMLPLRPPLLRRRLLLPSALPRSLRGPRKSRTGQ